MDKIYKQAKDEHVAGVVVYAYHMTGVPNHGFIAYKDEDGTERFTVAELRDAFQKGCIINLDEDYTVKPTQFTILHDYDSDIDFGYLYGYYISGTEEDGDVNTPFSVIAWDGEHPELFQE